MPFAMTNRRIHVASLGRVVGTGWLPPVLDPRDYTPDHAELAPEMKRLAERLTLRKSKVLQAPPPKVDLRKWCSPIEDQGGLGACTAHAAVGVVEYFERRAFGKHLDGSRLFVYKATRNLLNVTGDTGAWLRNTMAALVICGVPNERYWPYTDQAPAFDQEPPQFVYAVADNFETTKYYCHDPLNAPVDRRAVLNGVKKYLAAGIPSMFGFCGYASFDSGDQPGHIPLPTAQELTGNPDWGHAIVAVGYSDELDITNTVTGDKTTGALLIRNSWGPSWGDKGYGWLPYEYVIRGIAMDFWSLLKMEYLNTDRFFD